MSRVLFDGKHLQLRAEGHWEFVTRPNATGVIALLAITDDAKLLLVEQFRPALGRYVIELPAGLVGDQAKEESRVEAARRELLEETGYEAGRADFLFEGASSSGLTDEVISFFHLRELRRVGEAKGDGSERMVVHEVELGRVRAWLREREREGRSVDYKIFAALFFAGVFLDPV